MEQVDNEGVLGHGLLTWAPPVTRIGLQDRSNVQRPCECRLAHREIAMKNERGHGGAVMALVFWVLRLEAIGVFDDQSAFQSSMIL